MHVGKDSTIGDGGVANYLVQLVIVGEGKLQVSGSDGLLLGFMTSIASELENLICQILKNSSREDSCSWAYSLSEATLSELSVASAHWEEGACS